LKIAPVLSAAHANLGNALLVLGRLDEASAAYDRALELEPDAPGLRKNRALLWLLQGKYREGWEEYEWRWKCEELPERDFGRPLWDGSPLDGKTIVLHCEQGIGDTLQFIRYARLVEQRVGRVVVSCPKVLTPLLARAAKIERTVDDGQWPAFDVHAPLMSLPRIFGTTLETIPASTPYLEADWQLVEHWRQKLSSLSGFKVGIAWQGNPAFCFDRSRSVSLSQFAPLADVPGVVLISLQKGFGSEQVASLEGRFQVAELGPGLDQTGAFIDTAAVMRNLDLVITSDTAVPHLAGALGVKVWLATPFAPDWRWLLERDDSPWYPTMRLFRQHRRGDWHDVFKRIAEALKVEIAERSK
jgi:hypothetical protein